MSLLHNVIVVNSPKMIIFLTFKFVLIVSLIAAFVSRLHGLPSTLRLGAIFDHSDHTQELAFKYAIRKINERKDLLPETHLEYVTERVTWDDSFHASKAACSITRRGVAAIFGPRSPDCAHHVQSICDALEIPHMEARWVHSSQRAPSSINLFPHAASLTQAFIDVVRKLKWKSMTVIYEDSVGLIKLQEILKKPPTEDLRITVRQLKPAIEDRSDEHLVSLLKDIERRGETRIVLDCHVSRIYHILHIADRDFQMVSGYYQYFLTSMDISSVNLDEFGQKGASISWFRLVNPDKPLVKNVFLDWLITEERPALDVLAGHQGINVGAALVFDAVHLLASALQELDAEKEEEEVLPQQISCNGEAAWAHGTALISYMKITKFQGLTGLVKFDKQGFRSDFDLDILTSSYKGYEVIGSWNRTKLSLNMSHHVGNLRRGGPRRGLFNKKLRVTTILENPYVMLRKNYHLYSGNDQYEGYCVEMLAEIAKIVNFTYEINLVKDGKYGAQDKETGVWSGMVGELIRKEADLAVAPLTITFVREHIIDFTKPFMNLGISILFKRPERNTPGLFSFLAPLSIQVWVYMLFACIAISFMLFVLARFSPYEWYNPHLCNPEIDTVENQFTVSNSLWYTVGSLMRQDSGSDISPRAASTRLISGIWWFFTLIMLSSYTANLAAFLTVERMTTPIENAEDLSKQIDIKYGTLHGGSTMTFFRDSKMETYSRMWHTMETAVPNVFVNTTQEGIERVKKGNYAFLMESAMNEYIRQVDCELMQIGGLLDAKGYGIGTPRDSPYRDLVTGAILKLQEEQTLPHLYNMWWKEKQGGGCDEKDKSKKDKASALGMANVGGVFLVLVAGLGLSFVVAILEFIWKARYSESDSDSSSGGDDRQGLCSEMREDMCFAMKCSAPSTKQAKRRKGISALIENQLTMVPIAHGQFFGAGGLGMTTGQTPYGSVVTNRNGVGNSATLPTIMANTAMSSTGGGLRTTPGNPYAVSGVVVPYPPHEDSRDSLKLPFIDSSLGNMGDGMIG